MEKENEIPSQMDGPCSTINATEEMEESSEQKLQKVGPEENEPPSQMEKEDKLLPSMPLKKEKE